LTLYFESTTDDRLISYQTHEGQSSYVVELEPGSYYAYAWLPEDILGGGMYSEAVPCGLQVDCTDHSLIPVIVKPKQEAIGVDICDWYAPLGEVPLPPGKIEGMIAAFLREQHSNLVSDFEPVLQEMSMQGDVLKKLSARVFRITEGLFENETFLVTYHGKAIQIGAAIGGQGVSSMELSDLDQDGQAELYFTYSFGSGIHQTHLGVYAPAYAPEKIYEANTYYLGDLMLFSDQQNQVGVRIVERDPETNKVNFQETLGQLTLEKIGLNPVLKLELIDGLPEEIKEALIQPEKHQDTGKDFWTVYEDEEYGVRFAVPCFWEVKFPDQYRPSGTGYPIRNYSEEFSMSFGKDHGAVWESGGIKIDMNFTSGENWGLPNEATLEDYLTVIETAPDPDVELLSSEQILINGQKGLLVTTKDRFGIHAHYLFKVSEDMFLMFAVYPSEAIDNRDVQGILHSLAFSPDVEVAIPQIMPGDSPEGGEPSCLQTTPAPTNGEPLPTATSTAAIESTESGITITGVVTDISFSARLIKLKDPVEGIHILALNENCDLVTSNGEKIDLHSIQPGMTVQASGQPGSSDALLTSSVVVQ
jgi:hypothetical protein